MSTQPLRIALLMHSLNPRGGVVHTLELADALCERGHAVTVLAAATSGQCLFRTTRAQVSIASVSSAAQGLVEQVAARIRAMAEHLRRLPALPQFDVLHSQDSITANALADLCAAGHIEGYTRTVHHLDQFDDAQLQAWQARGVRAARRLLCVSALWHEVLARDWSVSADLVPNGVNLQRFHAHPDARQAADDARLLQGLGVQLQGPVWLAVGGVEARKNTLRLLHAFARVRPHRPQAQLVIAGGASLLDHDAEMRAFRQGLRDCGLADDRSVCLTGPLPDAALPALYRRASAVAMPSLREGFGLVALEALACGTPAIVSRCAPFTEHFAPHEVLWVDPFNVDDIAAALLRSLDPSATAPVRAAAAAVCQRWSWSRSAERHEQIYRQAQAPLHRPGLSSTPPETHYA